jgi:hypothetical protein
MREKSPLQLMQAAERAELRRLEGERMDRLGYGPGGRAAKKSITKLTPREAAIVHYAFHGCSIERLCALAGVEVNEPMDFETAADILKIKRKKLAWLKTQKPFQDLVAKELEAMKTSARLGAMQIVIGLAHERGENKAAERKVMLQAAQAILGDAVGTPPAGGANITINNGPVLQAGIVVRLRSDTKPTPLEVIEHEPRATALRRDEETQQMVGAVIDGEDEHEEI